MTAPNATPTPDRGLLWDTVGYFLRLGFVAFGGPAAHVAIMRRDLVERRKWLTDQDLLDHLAVASLIPGPNSTELVMHLGARRAGWAGLWLGGAAFILPAFAIVLVFAWVYVEYGETDIGLDLLRGVQPVILAIVVQAIWGLRTTAVRAWDTAVVAGAAVVLAVLGLNEAIVIVGAGAVLLAWRRLAPEPLRKPLASPLPDPRLAWRAARRWLRVTGRRAGGLVLLASPAGFALPELFWVFLKIGGTLYGSGYVLVAFLEADFVTNRGWLTEQTLVDAVAVGQFTPGPVFTTATFVGYVFDGFLGAIVATVAIFLPSFLFVAITHPLVPRLREAPWASGFLDGVGAAAVAVMGVVVISLGRIVIDDAFAAVVLAVAALVLVRFSPSTVWLVLAGGAAGLVAGVVP
ncbi:MAG: chromate efflux transporter [Chloroflexi bacterium]|nr:chromate efflux transporter [Chloroflexota bacterium]